MSLFCFHFGLQTPIKIQTCSEETMNDIIADFMLLLASKILLRPHATLNHHVPTSELELTDTSEPHLCPEIQIL